MPIPHDQAALDGFRAIQARAAEQLDDLPGKLLDAGEQLSDSIGALLADMQALHNGQHVSDRARAAIESVAADLQRRRTIAVYLCDALGRVLDGVGETIAIDGTAVLERYCEEDDSPSR